jgi:cold shock CspA family protein
MTFAMQIPLQITFRGMDHSDSIEAEIRQRAKGLERFGNRISRCYVTVDEPHRRTHRGNQYALRVDITTATGDVAVTRAPPLDDSPQDFPSVIRDAFDAAARQLEGDGEPEREQAPDQDHLPHGRVSRIFPRDGYGFLTATDGQEVYFHAKSVLNTAFAQLSVGSDVRFTLAPDDDGQQGIHAASVSPTSHT